MDYNKNLKEAQNKLNEESMLISTRKIEVGDYSEWSDRDWERFINKKQEIAKEFDVHEGDLKYI